MRLRHPMLRNLELHARMQESLRAFVDVESNPATGSLLLRFDPADTEMESRIRAAVAAIVAAITPPSAEPHAPTATSARRESAPVLNARAKREINRVAKVGSLAAMAVSIAALRSSRKLHAQAGYLSVFLMLTHAAFHWRRAFR
ncbi:hypothetical protein GJ654_11195 [Rhodoblastus acidophilus]|uniref:Uncharacterized protein n=2 Tax=Rhodoblastus acidophilus TaxID=1074 RepID=A0A6N8DM10_RHOAC|nr:hypothetical protein [Rhodoblastus acidophilus]